MRPPEVALELGTPPGSPHRTSSDFEEIPYPSDHWATIPPASSVATEELPLHYIMSEDKARRRVVRGPLESAGFGDHILEKYTSDEYDDEGKDVYTKMKPVRDRVGSGRLRHAPPPPVTSIVRLQSVTRSCLMCSPL
jgi:dolichyl-phosphate-mannose-protein mannosyltransferase